MLASRITRSLIAIALLAAPPAPAQSPPPAAQSAGRSFTEFMRFRAPEAYQGVAADAEHVYVVTDRGIGKYRKSDGSLVARWESPQGGPVIHFDGAVVADGRIYLPHSNYPQEPMTSSVEIFDAATLQPVGTHSFGIMWGSLTWVDRHDGAWWAVFANYSRVFGPSQRPYGNTHWTTLVRLDDQWQWQQAWIFPQQVLRRAEPMSISGGSWGADGLLYVTGHDHPEVYALRLPRMGSVLELVATYPLDVAGQGIAWDRSQPSVLWGVNRPTREVVGFRFR